MVYLIVHVEKNTSGPFCSQLPSPHTLTAVCSPGNRASEGRDGEVGEGAVLEGHADGVWRPVLSVLVQPVRRAQLQEEPSRARPRPTGADHRGGRHRDTTELVLPAVRRTFSLSLAALLYKQIYGLYQGFLNRDKPPGILIYIFLSQRLYTCPLSLPVLMLFAGCTGFLNTFTKLSRSFINVLPLHT